MQFDACLFVQVTALYIACRVQKNDVARLLIASGADPNIAARTNTGRLYTPLFWAVQHSDEQLCQILLEAGARADLGRDLLRSKHLSFQVKQLVQPFLMWDRMYHVLLDKFQPLASMVKYLLPRPSPASQPLTFLALPLLALFAISASDFWYVNIFSSHTVFHDFSS